MVLSECGRNATHAKDIDPTVGICAQAQQYTENRETLIKFLRDAGHTAEVIQQRRSPNPVCSLKGIGRLLAGTLQPSCS